jgi:glycosyltransferase involved in cell wall biosynthesis
MKVAIDTGALSSGHSVRGIGVMVGEQIAALKSESSKEEGIEIFPVDFLKEDLSKYDIVHYPYFFPYDLTLPSLGKASATKSSKIVVTIQDLIQLIYPDKYPPGIRGKINFFNQRLRLKNVDAIITISETSKKDIVRFLGVKEDKITVIYLAPKEIFRVITDKEKLREVSQKYNLPEMFVLYVGDVNYNKNIPTLVRACSEINIPLVICGKQAKDVEGGGKGLDVLRGPRDYLRFLQGKPHPELAHYELLIKLFDNRKIMRLGYVSDEDLVCIYNLATVYCQPSFYEGFGLPVLEAFACETPVIIAKTQALTEIAKGAALIADSKEANDFAKKILSLTKDSSKRLHLVRMGSTRLKNFSWEKTAQEMIAVYKKVEEDK